MKAPCLDAKVEALRQSEQAITYVGDYTEEELRRFLSTNIRIVKYIYDSLEMDFLLSILEETFSREDVPDKYIADFMDLQILDMNKVNFIRDHGSRKTKQQLIDHVLAR